MEIFLLDRSLLSWYHTTTIWNLPDVFFGSIISCHIMKELGIIVPIHMPLLRSLHCSSFPLRISFFLLSRCLRSLPASRFVGSSMKRIIESLISDYRVPRFSFLFKIISLYQCFVWVFKTFNFHTMCFWHRLSERKIGSLQILWTNSM